MGNLHEHNKTFLVISCSVLLRPTEKCFSQLQGNTKHIFCSITSLFFENCAFYEIMSKNILEPGRPLKTIWPMRIACWISKATNTHSGYVTIIAFPLQQTHFSVKL
jgi:hypothetical protein